MTEVQLISRRATVGDLAAVTRLLVAAELPTAGLESQFPAQYVVAEAGGQLVAVAGLEVYGTSGLLRSVAVDTRFRCRGIGRRLVNELLDAASAAGVNRVYLLTLTARDYFERMGFAVLERTQAPLEIQRSEEYAGVCPASSAFMGRQIEVD